LQLKLLNTMFQAHNHLTLFNAIRITAHEPISHNINSKSSTGTAFNRLID